jgi:50S ribosomal subunit-associated GTPase HflX
MKERYSEYEAIFVSAREMLNIEELKEKITQMIG